MKFSLKKFLFKENVDKAENVAIATTSESDPIIQMFIDTNKEKIEKQEENELNETSLLKILTENDYRLAAGVKGQSAVKQWLDNEYLKTENYEVISNEPGSTSEDIIVKDMTGAKIAKIEVKNVKRFTRPIYFFDKTISKTTKVTGSFFNLVNKVLEANLQGSNIELQGITVYDLLNSIKQQDPSSLEFASLPKEIENLLDPFGNLRFSFKVNNINMFSSHQPINSQGNPISVFDQKDSVMFKGETNIVYLQRNAEENNKIFSYIRVKKNENGYLVPIRQITTITLHKVGKRSTVPRAIGTPGKMAKQYFSYVSKVPKDQLITANGVVEAATDLVKSAAYEALKEKYMGVDYLAIVSNNEIQIISMNGKNPLGFKKDIGIFKVDNIISVRLRPAGATEINKLRVKLECKIDYTGFINPKIK